MANDLVKRLRDYEEYEQSRDGQIICVKSDMAQEAATYIEQLEAEVRELNMQVLASGSQAQEAYEAQLKAEAATAARIAELEVALALVTAREASRNHERLEALNKNAWQASRINHLEGYLTRANAATAAAYEVAARAIMEKCHDDMDRKEEAAIVRALASADQTAALDKLIAEAVKPYVEALRVLISHTHECERELTEALYHADFCGESKPLTDARAILAASKKGGV